MSLRPPFHLQLAAALRRLPDFPGRDTLAVWLLEQERSDRIIEIQVCGLRFQGPLDLMRKLATLRWTPPALAPIFDAALGPGDVLADVGAFYGMYALWGARRVGPTGRVYAFEPVPSSADRLRAAAQLNGYPNVEVVGSAVGAESTGVELYVPKEPTAGGISSRYHQTAADDILSVGQTTLDQFFGDGPIPALIKIDVEGMEPEVLRGARRLLAGDRAPPVVFETDTRLLELAGDSYARVVERLHSDGWTAWALGRQGLRPDPPGAERPGSLNVLITREDLGHHRKLVESLRNVRFDSDQNE